MNQPAALIPPERIGQGIRLIHGEKVMHLPELKRREIGFHVKYEDDKPKAKKP